MLEPWPRGLAEGTQHMSNVAAYVRGARIRITRGCPIDFEGIGPAPGAVGRVVQVLTREGDRCSCVAVRFDGLDSEWVVPVRYVEPIVSPAPARVH